MWASGRSSLVRHSSRTRSREVQGNAPSVRATQAIIRLATSSLSRELTDGRPCAVLHLLGCAATDAQLAPGIRQKDLQIADEVITVFQRSI